MDLPVHNCSIAIIGGGPAGLCAAIAAAGRLQGTRAWIRRSGAADAGGTIAGNGASGGDLPAAEAQVLLLEKNSQPGRKLLLSGSGQCNLTHTGSTEELLGHYQGNSRFLRTAFHELSNAALRSMLESAGVPTLEREDGKVFPVSRSAADVRNALVTLCKTAGARLITDFPVISVTPALTPQPAPHAGEHAGFIIRSAGKEVIARKVILCAGGASYPATGSDGGGYRLARNLGHSITPIRSGLAGIETAEPWFDGLEGVSVPYVETFILDREKKGPSKRGGILFTAKGLSGPSILDLSRFVEPGTIVRVNWIPDRPEARDRKLFAAVIRANGGSPIRKGLKFTGLPGRLIDILLSGSSIPVDKASSEISAEEMSRLFDAITGHPVTGQAVEGFEKAMVTCGGVPLDEVSPGTLKSKIADGLYFAGEILDIDGDSGGYNIQAACSTGYTAGISAARETRRS